MTWFNTFDLDSGVVSPTTLEPRANVSNLKLYMDAEALKSQLVRRLVGS
jgi:hypothetical protein